MVSVLSFSEDSNLAACLRDNPPLEPGDSILGTLDLVDFIVSDFLVTVGRLLFNHDGPPSLLFFIDLS